MCVFCVGNKSGGAENDEKIEYIKTQSRSCRLRYRWSLLQLTFSLAQASPYSPVRALGMILGSFFARSALFTLNALKSDFERESESNMGDRDRSTA